VPGSLDVYASAIIKTQTEFTDFSIFTCLENPINENNTFKQPGFSSLTPINLMHHQEVIVV